ncbi:hypothetical protein ACFHWD_04040 [Clostridium sp. MT-14]|uniref:hypothetical protein n=1 Tax=Clostridium sp. MT-14 TaxID=3348360 RepID=UPI0035F29DA0
MLRNVIEGENITRIYKISKETRRGSLMVKNLTTESADKADDVGTETYLLDFDFQPMGYQSDMEISAYTDQADIVPAGTLGILVKPAVGSVWATDQINMAEVAKGDYLMAGTGDDVGKFVKAISGKTTVYKYVGEYNDAGHELQAFEIVEPKTIA